jgi:uncharacterized membrane-anchored protein
MTSPSKLWLALGAVLASQVAVLAWIVGERVHLLATGREIVLDVVPVDPRSLFRGDYVILTYPAASIPRSKPDGSLVRVGETVYVVLAQDGQSQWRQSRCLDQAPASVAPNEIVLRGTVSDQWRAGNAQARFGIESYFVPEGDGRTIESDIGKKLVSVQVAVGRNGQAAIKGLLIDGKPAYTTTLF